MPAKKFISPTPHLLRRYHFWTSTNIKQLFSVVTHTPKTNSIRLGI